MEELDPTNQPTEGGGTEGQPEESQTQDEPQVDPIEDKLAKLEKENRDLQYRLTQRGRELKKFQESTPVPQPQEADEFDWNNPGASIGKYVGKALSDFESRQEQRRQAEEMIRQTAEQHDIPVRDLQEYYRKLEDAANDPLELMNTVARMYRADHAEEAVSHARDAAEQSVQRNARAVTSKGGPTQPTPEQKPLDDMSDKELDEFVKREYGVADWPT